jgi:hypothetical protein
MKRLKKAILLPVRSMASRWNRPRLYYWSETRLFELRTVRVMPQFYYRGLYQLSMSLLGIRRFRPLADRLIHTIPYDIRFHMA